MALVPYYQAFLSQTGFRPIAEWVNPVTYNRLDVDMLADTPAHIPEAHSETKNMFPIMEGVADLGAPNMGFSGTYADGVLVPVPSMVMPAPSPDRWNYSYMLQYQVPRWHEEIQHMEDFHEAILARKIEDTWITTAGYATARGRNDDIALGILHDEKTLTLLNGMHRNMHREVDGTPVVHNHLTPCAMQARIYSGGVGYALKQEDDCVIAFENGVTPTIEQVTKETCPAIKFQPSHTWEPPGTAGLQFIPWNGGNIYIKDAQPLRWNETNSAAAEAAFFAAQIALFQSDHAHLLENGATNSGYQRMKNVTYTYEIVDDYAPIWSTFAGQGEAPGSYEWLLANYPAQAAAIAVASSHIYNSVKILNIDAIVETWGEFGVEGPDLTSTVPFHTESGRTFCKQRPKAWKHDDPEFIGYFPFHYTLIQNQALVNAYAANPTAIFDGLFFERKVRLATVTRAWQMAIRYVEYLSSEYVPGDSILPMHTAVLQVAGLLDTETGEITGPADYCAGMVPVEFSGIYMGMIGNPVTEEEYWEGFPAVPITIPGGTFLLESGSPAPIYPDFHGAFIYDTHLKKWGRMDLEHKAVFDYMSVNTYKPGEQSFSRFGIFGGVLQADGKIYLFDDEPADSFITYGKVGYYRQGMTSPEEVRVHMRNPSDFTVRVSSSIEGKLIEPTFTTSTDFVQTSRGIHYGGYAAKWHNITISGKYDITYLEFRGITTGKR